MNRGKNAFRTSKVDGEPNVEWGTPPELVNPITKEFLGGNFIDPFSSEIANRTIGAKKILTKEDDGFIHGWPQMERGTNVWINHPFGTKNNRLLVQKIREESHHINRFCGVCYISFGAEWFNDLMELVDYVWIPDGSSPGCTSSGRVCYVNLRTGRPEPSPQRASLFYFRQFRTSHWQEELVLADVHSGVMDLGGSVWKQQT